jgi:hypothetical protein
MWVRVVCRVVRGGGTSELSGPVWVRVLSEVRSPFFLLGGTSPDADSSPFRPERTLESRLLARDMGLADWWFSKRSWIKGSASYIATHKRADHSQAHTPGEQPASVTKPTNRSDLV